MELDLRTKLEVAIATPHEDEYNSVKQGEISRILTVIDELENRKAKGEIIRTKVKWQTVGNKYSAEFFKSDNRRTTKR